MNTLLPTAAVTMAGFDVAPATDATTRTVFDLELDLIVWSDPESERFPYRFCTSRHGGPAGEYLPLRSWANLEQLLAEVIAHGPRDYLTLQHADQPIRWAQVAPEGSGTMRVELSDGKGWVNHFRSPRPDGAWSTEKAYWILRNFVSRKHVRGDGTQEPVPHRR